MPHFSESEIEEVKRMNRLEDVARATGCELKKHGVNKLVTLCPFHEEKTPSCVIDRVRNTFKCFGCGKGGDVISWKMETEGMSFTEAVAALGGMSQTRAGGLGLGAEKESRKSTIRTEQLFDPEMTAEEMLERTAQYYHEVGMEAPELREYLVKRGLLPKDADEEFLHSPGSILNFFKLGLANRTLGLKVEKGDRVGGAEVRRKLQEIGVVRSSGHEHLAGSLVIPILDEEGRVVQLYGRKILDNLRQGTPKHLYLAGSLKGIFNVQGLHDYLQMPNSEPRTLILCEAILDALTFWVHGFKNVTACYGVTNFTEEVLQFIVKYCFTVVYISFDPDEPGDRGAFAVAEKLAQFGIECRRVKFPPGLDANEFALKVSNPTKALGELLDLAEGMPGSGFRVPGSGLLKSD